MKKQSKSISALLVLSWIALNSAFAADEAAGLKDEGTTLENLYQQKAHAVLDTLLNPEDYTLVISATLKNDESKLKEYHSMIEKKFLPGMNMNDPAGFGPEHNILYGLKQKVEVQLILSDRVPADRDALVKDVLKTKLKLNEEGGDSIAVLRAAHKVPNAESAPITQKLPELSTKMVIFFIIMAVIAVIAAAMWLYRRKEDNAEEARANQPNFIEKERIIEAVKEEKGDEVEEKKAPVVEEVIKTPEQLAEEQRILAEKIEIAKETLLRLSQEYLSIVTRALEEFTAQGNLTETTLFLESLGWEPARKLFKNIDSKLWGRVAANLRDRKEDPTLEQIYTAIHSFERYALSTVLEKAGNNSENPFAFIFQLTSSERIDLLVNESTYNIALIAIYCTGAQMGDLMLGLDAGKQNEILYNITKIKHLPEAEVQASITNLLNRLEGIKKEPSIHVDGLSLAAKFIRSLDPVKEEELYESIRAQHPEEAESLRRAQVMFQDIPYYPSEMVRKVADGLDADDILKSLVGYPADYVDAFLALLPTKKALMIQNDLFHMSDSPAPYQCAAARRKITTKVEQEFEKHKFNIPDYWKMFDQQAAASAAEQPAESYEQPPADGGSSGGEVTQVNEVPAAEPASEQPAAVQATVQSTEEDDKKKAA